MSDSREDLVMPTTLGTFPSFGEPTTFGMSTSFGVQSISAPSGHLERSRPEPRRSTRSRYPSHVFGSPYEVSGEPHPIPSSLLGRYKNFRTSPNKKHVVLSESRGVLDKAFFANIEEPKSAFHVDVVDLFMMSRRSRLIARDGVLDSVTIHNTVILGTDFIGKLDKEFSNCCIALLGDIKMLDYRNNAMFSSWDPPNDLLDLVNGKDGCTTMRDWLGAKQIIIPCLVEESYIIVLVKIESWTAEIFDPSYYGLKPDQQKSRPNFAMAIMFLLSHLLEKANFWVSRATRWRQPLSMVIPSPIELFTLKDGVQNGPYACMCVEKLISGLPSITWGNKKVVQYRSYVAAHIFALCDDD